MTKGTKIFRIIICVILALCVLCIAALISDVYNLSTVDSSRENYGIFVAGTEVTKENRDDILGDGTVYYESAYNILVFDGANITSDQSIVASIDDIGIRLNGENKFTSTCEGEMPLIYASDYYLDKDIYIYGDGTLTIEFQNTCTSSSSIQCADLTVLSDITINTPDCSNISNGIVCDSSFKLLGGATVTVNSGSSASTAALRVRGNMILEAGTKVNVTLEKSSTELAKGISVSGDLIIGDGSSVNVTVKDDTAKTLEALRVNGLLEVGVGATLTANTNRSYAIECYGAIKLCDDAVISATSATSDVDVICYGAVTNYGATVNGEIEALGQLYNKSKD